MRLFSMGHSTIVLYDDGALTTKKSAMVIAVLVAFITRTNKVITPIGWTTSPVKPFRGTGVGHNLSGLILVLMKAS